MDRSAFRRLMVAVAIVLAAPLAVSHAGFFGLESESFAFCSSNTFCVGEQTCFEQSLGETCSVGCSAPDEDATCHYSRTDSNPDLFSGEAGFWLGDVLADVAVIDVDATPVPGALDLEIYTRRLEYFPSEAEVAVIRFVGAPDVFYGIDVRSVSELVDLGIIEASDVLWVKNDFPIGFGDTFNTQVDTAGIPPDEIAIFIAGEGSGNPNCHEPEQCEPWAVPAASVYGALVLTVVLGILGAFARRERD